jgi:DNA polymerase-3 subunit epsilon
MVELVAGLDLETTGLSQPEGHRIVEVAAVIYELNSGRELGRFETQLNPERGIDPKAQAVHGISYESLAGKPTWLTIAPKLSALLSRCSVMVAHNGLGFDAPFLWGEFLRVGVPLPELRLVDTMLEARWATPDGAIPNLAALCFACGVEYDKAKAHRAAYDVEVMMASFFSQRDRGFFTVPAEPYRYSVPKEKKK